MVLLSFAGAAAAGTLSGWVKEDKDGKAGPGIVGATLWFHRVDSDLCKTVKTSKSGTYSVVLPDGKYFVTAAKDGYMTHRSDPNMVTIHPDKANARTVHNCTLKKVAKKPRLVLKLKGYHGRVFAELPDGSHGNKGLDKATVTFTHENGSFSRSDVTDKNGSYSIKLLKGKYKVKVTRNFYLPYETGEGWCVYNGGDWQTGNFWLKEDPAMVIK